MPDLIGLLLEYRYWIIIPLAILEGPLVAFVAGALAAQNLFSMPVVYLILLAKDVVFEGGIFALGKHGGESSRVRRWLERRKRFSFTADTIRRLWERHGFATMFFAKLSYGLSAPFLLTAGLSGMTYRRFLTLAVPITLAQYAVFMGLGYVVGDRLSAVSDTWTWIGIALAAVAVLILVTVLMAGWSRRKLAAEAEEVRS